jgi:DNA-binding IclR family transcriptional regulator
MDRATDPNVLQTTDTSLSILASIKSKGGATLAELVEETGQARSSAYSHLQTLREHDLVTKEGETYHVGLPLLGYGEHAKCRKPEYDLARSAVDDLVERVGDEAGFAVPENGRAVLLYNAANVSDATFQVGEVGPMHATASGKAMLAAYSDAEVESVLAKHGLSSEDERGIGDPDALWEELERTRHRGYSVVDEEYVGGMRSMGVAVPYPDGRVFGALHVSAPAYRGTLEEFRSSVEAVMLPAAEALERSLRDSLG